jgi:pimeloyl-ACP methyl ester carboxylesterase
VGGLHVREWGDGDRTVVLVHGLTTDSGSWWRVGPLLAERGWRVLAPDLPGHGRSPRGPYSLAGFGEALVASVPAGPELAVGHSLGGLVLAQVVNRVNPARAVYVDPAWTPLPGAERAGFFRGQKSWTFEQLAAAQPRWPAGAVREKLAALSRWDPETLLAVQGFPGYRPAPPAVPSLVLAAATDAMVDDRKAAELRGDGFEVRVVPGTGHVVHNDDVDAFLAALDGWL